VIYLPGTSREKLRSAEKCPDNLKPIIPLQYNGIFFSKSRSEDWTVEAYFATNENKEGLGLDLKKDNKTLRVLYDCLTILLSKEHSELKNETIDLSFLDSLLVSDPIKELLIWLNKPKDSNHTIDSQNNAVWKSFVNICLKRFSFNPESNDPQKAVKLMASKNEKWIKIWDRFCESPENYLGVLAHLWKLPDCSHDKLWNSPGTDFFEAYPKWNQLHEDNLRKELFNISELFPKDAMDKIKELEKEHRSRRELIWNKLIMSPLAAALKHLFLAVEACEIQLEGESFEDLEKLYIESGWKVDSGIINAIFEVSQSPKTKNVDIVTKKDQDTKAVSAAIRAFYLPWLEKFANRLQKLCKSEGYPAGKLLDVRSNPSYEEGDFVLFVDGLRFDNAKNLSNILTDYGLEVKEEPIWSAIPSITETGKPAVSPVREKFSGTVDNKECKPHIKDTGTQYSGDSLRSLLKNSGWEYLSLDYEGKEFGKAWCENNKIDHTAHISWQNLIIQLNDILKEIGERVLRLLKKGWKRVIIVTDHGWLLMPGGLPKMTLSQNLTESLGGRVACLKENINRDVTNAIDQYPWHWNSDCYYALANGISCFKEGLSFAHGGLSLQECLTLRLTVTRTLKDSSTSVTISVVKWTTDRLCTVTVMGDAYGFHADLRVNPKEKNTSVAYRSNELKINKETDGTEKTFSTSVKFKDDKLEGEEAFVVIIDEVGEIIDYCSTVLGVINK
jgi:hypothetical protein